jgi:hypothetical protein
MQSSSRTQRIASNADHVRTSTTLGKKWGRNLTKKLPSAILKLIRANIAKPLSDQSNKSYSFHVFHIHFPVSKNKKSKKFTQKKL